MKNINPTMADLKLISKNDEVYLIDIKTVKPNKGGFKEFKRTLLDRNSDDPVKTGRFSAFFYKFIKKIINF